MRQLIDHIGCGIAQHSFGANVKKLNHAFFIGGDARKGGAIKHDVLQNARVEQRFSGLTGIGSRHKHPFARSMRTSAGNWGKTRNTYKQ